MTTDQLEKHRPTTYILVSIVECIASWTRCKSGNTEARYNSPSKATRWICTTKLEAKRRTTAAVSIHFFYYSRITVIFFLNIFNALNCCGLLSWMVVFMTKTVIGSWIKQLEIQTMQFDRGFATNVASFEITSAQNQ